ncbi:hypothetical protein LEP1GSC188_5139 [Leptospira weilii serovar Topaz str. LT2116]|uniref:Uncharacterized protein n=1 Tax=Leptospira weilii serovar Topaz str. LT2116 TaxID=1088540 RepID=M3EK68_9LEPT|nr:hypothetical protein LEP1GSC188_5139 [Leptospira weilii serovar Topaz str. LT2116]
MTPQVHIDPFFSNVFLIVFQKNIYFKASLNDIMNSLKYAPVLRPRFRTDSLLTM